MCSSQFLLSHKRQVSVSNSGGLVPKCQASVRPPEVHRLFIRSLNGTSRTVGLLCTNHDHYFPRGFKFIICIISAAIGYMNTSVSKASNNRRILNDISTRRVVGMYLVPGHAGVWGNEIADTLARDSSVQKFVGPELSLEVSTQNVKRKIQRWLDYQHLAKRRGPSGTQKQVRKLFSGPSPTTKTRLFSC
jgi:hypothetical protein